MFFTQSKIAAAGETAAEELRRARTEKNTTIEEASRRLSIKTEYLAALERDDYGILPSGIYAQKILRKYASWLKLNPDKLLKKYQKENKTAETIRVFSQKTIKKSELLVLPKILKNIIIALLVLALLLYLGLYLKSSFSAPKVEIISPPDNLITESNVVEVVGKAESRTQITINNQQVLKDKEGNFRQTVVLKKGINDVVIEAQNKYSQKKIITKEILVK